MQSGIMPGERVRGFAQGTPDGLEMDRNWASSPPAPFAWCFRSGRFCSLLWRLHPSFGRSIPLDPHTDCGRISHRSAHGVAYVSGVGHAGRPLRPT